MASKDIQKFRSFMDQRNDNTYACFTETSSMTIQCKCNKIIQFRDKSSLDSHLKSAFHLALSSQ